MSELRVATWNVYLGADLSVVFSVSGQDDLADRFRAVRDQVLATDFPARAEAIAALLVRERVDVVGLQEVARWSRTVEDVGGGSRQEVWLDFLALLLAALERAGAAYDAHASSRSFRGGARVPGGESMSVVGHNVVLVRRGSGVTVLAVERGDFARTLEVSSAGVPDLVLDVARSWAWVDAQRDGATFRFVNTHTEVWDPRVRDAQREEVLAAVGDPGWPVVLMGDLNATPEQVGMPEGYVDAWEVAGDGTTGATSGQAPGLTNPTSGLERRIDYVFVRGAAISGCRVVGDRPEDRARCSDAGDPRSDGDGARRDGGLLWPSDHAGVVATLSL